VTARAASELAGPVRVGVLLPSFDVPAWAWTAIRDAASSHAEIVAVALIPAKPRRGNGPIRGALRRVDELLDRRVPADEDAFTPRDARPLLAGVPVVRDVADLRALHIDVLLWLGAGRRPRGQLLRVARAGVWAIRLGDRGSGRGGTPGFWEVHDDLPVIRAALEMLGGSRDQDRTLAATSSAPVRTSLKRTRNALIWTALPLLGRTLARLHLEGVDGFLDRVERENSSPEINPHPRRRAPGAVDLIVHAGRRSARLAGLIARKLLTRQQWVLFFGFADDLMLPPWQLRPLVPPIDRFWADPHAVLVGGRYYVFVEELPYSTGKGHIAVIEIDGEGRAGASRKVLAEPHHLSYPMVFEHQGDYYMVPESSHRGTIDLYRATAFPDKWVFVDHLMTGIEALDATLLWEGDRWWLFASVIRYKGAGSGELNLYTSERLIGGEWRLHPASPLSADVLEARPAGAILRRGTRLYRPVQDGSGRYGRAVRLREILELTEATFRDELVARIEPDWDKRITRTHTLAHAGRLTVVDALWSRRRWVPRGARRDGDGGPDDDQPRRSFTAST
jgi:hypothetical protein